MFCLCFVIFVFFVVRKLAIVLNWGFPDNHLIFIKEKIYTIWGSGFFVSINAV